MNKLRLKLIVLALVLAGAAKADEGMWLLQLMKEQHSIDLMKKAGLQLEADDLYNPNGVSLKDAVGIFGSGCTGEIISGQGLILTNHHCGYGAIQQHSSVEHDYLTDGFWAQSMDEEIPTPGLTFKFVDRIEDVTDIVNERIAKGEVTEEEALSPLFCAKLKAELFEKSDLKGKPGIETTLLPFYAGNKYYMIYMRVYKDVRMVGAPPSSIGKFGGETDNWMWPRHTGDFSIFRVYGDADGNPAEYNEKNVPLNTDKHFALSIKGIENGDYAMVMGFPGSTDRYLTRSEVEMTMKSVNEPRIAIREARQGVLRKEMAASDKVRIQYASKFAQSSNYWKNAIGMNKAIIDNKVLETKTEQENNFARFADEVNNAAYKTVVSEIDGIVNELSAAKYNYICNLETYIAIEYRLPIASLDTLVKHAKVADQIVANARRQMIREAYAGVYNKDFDVEVDKKVAKAVLPLVKTMLPADKLPSLFKYVDEKYKGDLDKFIDDAYEKSIFSSEANLEKFLKKPSKKALEKDPGYILSSSLTTNFFAAASAHAIMAKKLGVPHKTYIRGLGEMKLKYKNLPSYPDANFTLRLTYGNVKAYDPRNAVHYDYYTTLDGVMEKEDPQNSEFVVPAKLKELYNNKDFGRYAMADGKMPVAFITTNDITGGNSGSPVINSKGELIGAAFDGNWESLSGDINFDDQLQRCICVDIRYVLFIIEKYGNCKRLIDEMTIVE